MSEIKENRKKWVEALRSGKYTQGTHALRWVSDDSMCCLGVLCDVVAPDSWVKGDESGQSQYWGHIYSITTGVPQSLLTNKVGLTDNTGAFITDTKELEQFAIEYGIPEQAGKYHVSLALLNDNGWSHQRIAAIIEREPEGLFVDE